MPTDLLNRARGVVNVNALVIAALGLGLLSNVLIAALFGLSHRVDAFFAAGSVDGLDTACVHDGVPLPPFRLP